MYIYIGVMKFRNCNWYNYFEYFQIEVKSAEAPLNIINDMKFILVTMFTITGDILLYQAKLKNITYFMIKSY